MWRITLNTRFSLYLAKWSKIRVICRLFLAGRCQFVLGRNPNLQAPDNPIIDPTSRRK